MADAQTHGKGRGNLRVALAASVVIAAAIGMYIYRSPQADGARRILARITRALGRLAGKEDRVRKPVGVIIQEIEHGDAVQRAQAIGSVCDELTGPAEFVQLVPALIGAMEDESKIVRDTATAALNKLILLYGQDGSATQLEESLVRLLDEPEPELRVQAAGLLRTLAALRKLDVPPPRLLECLDDDSGAVRAAAAASVIEYGQGPELFLPVALRRLPNESPVAWHEFTHILESIRFRPTVLSLLIEGLSSENSFVCVSAATALNHMGLDAGPARPAIMALLRRELKRPTPGWSCTHQLGRWLGRSDPGCQLARHRHRR